MGWHRQRHEISKQNGSQTVQRIRQRRVVCCSSANWGTAGADFTHHKWSQKKKSIDGVRRLSSFLLRFSATRDIRGVRRRRRQSRTTTCVQSYAWARMGSRPPLKIGKRKFKKRWTHYEADWERGEASIHETGASNLTSLKIPCPKRARRKCETKQTTVWRRESWESWAWRNSHWSDRFWTQPKPLGMGHWPQLPIFLPLTKDTSCAVQKSWHVTWQRQQQQTGRRWWDWGDIWKTDPGFDCGTNFKKRRAIPKRSKTQIGQVAEEHAAVQQEDTQLQDLISSKSGAKHKLLWVSVQRKPNCTA